MAGLKKKSFADSYLRNFNILLLARQFRWSNALIFLFVSHTFVTQLG